MENKYAGPPGEFRFQFGGLSTISSVDTLVPNKYPLAINVRGAGGKSVCTRPGYTQLFTAGGTVTDVRAYTTLGTDNLPRYLARRSNNGIYLDDGVLKGTLAGTANGAFMIPYRPNMSPQSWMYIGTDGDYQKFSAPDGSNNVTQYKVGIREPSDSPTVSVRNINFYDFSALAANWTNAGTAGATADAPRVVDTAGVARAHPGSNGIRWSVQVATNVSYQIGMIVTMGLAGAFTAIVQDVCPPISAGGAITIRSIRYYSGTTGRCVIVPTGMTTSFGGAVISSLRRGSLINLSGGGGEICLVESVTPGPDGSIAIEVTTTGAHAAAETVTGIPAIVVSGIDATVTGQAISSASVTSTITAGTGTLTQTLATNPFTQPLTPGTPTAHEDDYVCFGILMDDMTQLVQGKIIFDIKNGAADYATDALYYTFNIESIIVPSLTIAQEQEDQSTQLSALSEAQQLWEAERQAFLNRANQFLSQFGWSVENVDLVLLEQYIIMGAISPPPELVNDYYRFVVNPRSPYQQSVTTLTPLPTSQWGLVRFPIRALTRLGKDDTRTLSNCQGVRISLETTGTINAAISSFWVGGGGPLDVGSNGGYFYRFRGRNTTTGARGNPSPSTRYGVYPARQRVRIEMTDTTSDAQVDVFDVYRWGGSITQWRQIGVVKNSGSPVVFTDQYSDSAALGGEPLEVDNHEPWPTIEIPFVVNSGGGNTIVVEGTLVTVSGASITWPSTIARWLPGTIIQIAGLGSYTLRMRPTQISATSYRFELIENAGYLASASSFVIREPIVGNQKLPYLWGPNEQGDVFACGDSLRPGSIYFCNQHNPDSASDRRNIEVSPPSEPLLGGEVLGGLCMVASSDRWWALYPAYDTPQRYYKVERQIGRGLAAPYGRCADGDYLYFWSKDGIWRSDGDSGESLTDEDLYDLFPHEGVPGSNITYNGVVTYAPDYKRAATFRLGVCNGYLYADYQDSTGTYRTLVYDVGRKAWSVDQYASPATVHYGVEQPEGSLGTGTPTLYPMLIMGHLSGAVTKQTDLANDISTAIACTIATGEFNGGHVRRFGEFGDLYLESIPISTISAQPLSAGVAVGGATTVSADTVRTYSQISLGGGVLKKFVGMKLTWTDDFGVVSAPTTLLLWQPSVLLKPETTTDRVEDWDDCGDARVKYLRGFVIEADTFNASKTFLVRNKDDNTTTSYSITHNGQKVTAFEFATPILSHLVRIEPQGTGAWRFFQVRWTYELWPELTKEYSPWFDMNGNDKAKYVRGFVIPIDTNGAAVVLRVISSDGASIDLAAVTTTAKEKEPVAFAFTVPLIGHEFQIQPQSNCRLWYNECQWHYEPWPELTTESTPWMDAGTKGAKYFRGVTIPVDTGGVARTFTIYSSDGGNQSLGSFTTTASEKTEIAASIVGPFIGHEVRIQVSGACRIWHDEIRFEFDPYPELTTAYSPWFDLGNSDKVKYVRGLVVPIDTNGAGVALKLVSSDGASISLASQTTVAGVKTPVAFAFTVPLIGHEFQIQPQTACRIWHKEAAWNAEEWPELTAEASPWMDCGNKGAKYFRSVTIPVDTNGIAVTLTLHSSDDASTVNLGPFTTTAGRKTEVAAAIPTPFIGHEIQIIPSAVCRIWHNEARWVFDPYPELVAARTAVLQISDPKAKYVQGIRLAADTSNVSTQFNILYDGGQAGPNFTAAFNGKQTRTFIFTTPFIAHNVQLVPQANARIWVEESMWEYEPTPDSLAQWGPTQQTSHGLTGYMHVGYVEIAYESSAPVTLAITASDGISPAPVVLPSTGSAYSKVWARVSPNKGRAYTYKATCVSAFRLFLPDTVIWVKQWGSKGPYQPSRILGDQYGDKARV